MKTRAAVEIAHLRKTYGNIVAGAHAGRAPGHQQRHPARRGGGSDQGLDAGPVPPAESLLVLAGYALVFALIARRLFRWE